MPEGPSILLLKEAVEQFAGKKVLDIYGDSKIDKDIFLGKKIIAFRTWGKHFLICFDKITIRIHFLLFGSFTINEKKEGRSVRLGFRFRNGELNFYASAVKVIEGDITEAYDWSGDVMSDAWDEDLALLKLMTEKDEKACDVMLDQEIFSGVGNIIKNEVLYRIRLHPESVIKAIPERLLERMVKEARVYSFQFLEWKREFVLKKHWLAHTKKICKRCQLPIIKKYTGKRNRRSFFCSNCQKLYK